MKNRNYSVTVECQSCTERFTMKVAQEDYMNWKFGDTLIQRAMPYLSDDERQLLISQTCGRCFDVMAAEDD